MSDFEVFWKHDPIDGEKKDQKDAKKTLDPTDDTKGKWESYGQNIDTDKKEDSKEKKHQDTEKTHEEYQNFITQNRQNEWAERKKDPPPDEAELAMAFNDFPPKTGESEKSQTNRVEGGSHSESMHA